MAKITKKALRKFLEGEVGRKRYPWYYWIGSIHRLWLESFGRKLAFSEKPFYKFLRRIDR